MLERITIHRVALGSPVLNQFIQFIQFIRGEDMVTQSMGLFHAEDFTGNEKARTSSLEVRA